MRKVYFVRHAQPDMSVHDDILRPLTSKGKADSKLVTRFLEDKSITKVYSSTCKRSVDTVSDFADKHGFAVICKDCFKERIVSNEWIEDFDGFTEQQWGDFDYKLDGGESLNETQSRCITGLLDILNSTKDENIVIGTHGTALSSIIHYFNHFYSYSNFSAIKDIMPLVVCITFDGLEVIHIERFDITK